MTKTRHAGAASTVNISKSTLLRKFASNSGKTPSPLPLSPEYRGEGSCYEGLFIIKGVAQRHAGLLLSLVALALGCEYTPPGKPTTVLTTQVSGQITANGEPIERGWVTLFPTGATLGDQVTTRIGADGRYKVDRAGVGPLQARIELTSEAADVLVQRFPGIERRLQVIRGVASPLMLTTQTDRPTTFDFDMVRTPVRERSAVGDP